MVVMPSSPPKKPRRISALDATNSAKPSEIMAKAMPPRLVETEPNTTPNSIPPAPPTSGIRTSGTGTMWRIARFMTWTAQNAPSP